MNTLFGKPNAIPVSLGFNCSVARCIELLSERDGHFYERQVFDWLGTSMWAIVMLIKDEFRELLDKRLLEYRKRYIHTDELYPTNIKYDIPMLHEFEKRNSVRVREAELVPIVEKYQRRIARFNGLLRGDKEIVFIRLERDMSDKISTPESAPYLVDEMTSLLEFVKILKAAGTRYSIVFLTYAHEDGYDPENRIYFLHCENTRDMKREDVFEALEQHAPLMKSLLAV
jgi:hypothetical protein